MTMIVRRLQRLLVSGTVLCLIACGEPRLDADDLEGSAAKVRRALSEQDRIAFDAAIDLVREIREGGAPGAGTVEIDGMTGPELLVEAQRIALRREVSWVEDRIAFHQEVVAAKERLASLRVSEIGVVEPGNGVVNVRLTLHNETGETLDSGFVRLSLDLAQGRGLKTEEFIPFRPPLLPGDERRVETRISPSFSRTLFSSPDPRLTVEFTSLERCGAVLVEEPLPDALAKAQENLEEARQELAELRRRLAAAS